MIGQLINYLMRRESVVNCFDFKKKWNMVCWFGLSLHFGLLDGQKKQQLWADEHFFFFLPILQPDTGYLKADIGYRLFSKIGF